MVRKMDSLFVYGTLRPGHVNAYILEDIGGEWLAGSVKGTFYERGWGAAADFPGIVLDEEGTSVEGFLFLSPTWTRTGQCWMNSKTVMIGLR
jgi:gamma-glutamylcyclotransferase (GGCT)/AIG2-like uncharacterized protein YtfP